MNKDTRQDLLNAAIWAHEDGIGLTLHKLGNFNDNCYLLETLDNECHPIFASVLGLPASKQTDGKNPRVLPFKMIRAAHNLNNEEIIAYMIGMNRGSVLPFYERQPTYHHHIAGVRARRILTELEILPIEEEINYYYLFEYVALTIAIYFGILYCVSS